MANICCLLWSALLIVQAMEWELITQLISFQTSIPLGEMDVQKTHFIAKIENATYKIFISLNILNGIFHAIKIIMCILWMTNLWHKKNTQFNAVVISNNIWVISLSVMILVTGTRLLIFSSRYHLEEYNNHKNQTLIMMLVLIFCEMNSVYFAAFSKSLAGNVNDLKFLAGLVVTFLPSVCFLFVKRTEDCIGCFNKFTSRYSSFQYASTKSQSLVSRGSWVNKSTRTSESLNSEILNKSITGHDAIQSRPTAYSKLYSDTDMDIDYYAANDNRNYSQLVRQYAGDYQETTVRSSSQISEE